MGKISFVTNCILVLGPSACSSRDLAGARLLTHLTHLTHFSDARLGSGHLPRARGLAGAPWVRDRHYSRTFSWRGRGNGNRNVDRGRTLRKRPWGKEDPVSSQMPHGPSCPSRATY